VARRYGGGKVLLTVFGGVAVVFLLLWAVVDWEGMTLITTELKSPDGRMTLRVLDRARSAGRNFRVALLREGVRKPEFLYVSPDEGRLAGTERFIWSVDGRYAVLVGRHFSVGPECEMASGESLYLLIDAANGVVMGCNAKQSESYHPFTLETVRALAKWPEDGALRAKAAGSQE
jgi:hypothetical protein